jgi:predicted aspartyl protease
VTLHDVLASRNAALKALGVHEVRYVEVTGSVNGGGLQGSFHRWRDGSNERLDEWVGPRFQSWVRRGATEYAQDENGNVCELHGAIEQRRLEQRFILDGGFTEQQQFDRFIGRIELPDGRSADAIQVTRPGEIAETVDLDSKTFMIDRISYADQDGAFTFDYYDYKVFSGALVAQTEIDSNGDHNYDLNLAVENVRAGKHFASTVFDVPANTQIQTSQPVTVPLIERGGHYYVRVRIRAHEYTFLLDTGAQTTVFDAAVAEELKLDPQGHLDVFGAGRTRGLGLAKFSGNIQIGSSTLPLHVVAVFDDRSGSDSYQADGVLGYPFFASAEVTIDAAGHRMTIAKPGALHTAGTAIPVNVERQSIELDARVDQIDGRFLLDTGNNSELLLFSPFVKAHPGLVTIGRRRFITTSGIGGSIPAFSEVIDELDFGPYRFFNRNTDIILPNSGAFSGRLNAGNIGMGVLRNLVVTFDVANARIYAAQSSAYDDGRYRTRTETLPN